MSSAIITDDEQKIAGLATILTYNRFSHPKDHITDSTFAKRRCSKPMTDEQIVEAAKRSETAIKEIQDAENPIPLPSKSLSVPDREDKQACSGCGDPFRVWQSPTEI